MEADSLSGCENSVRENGVGVLDVDPADPDILPGQSSGVSFVLSLVSSPGESAPDQLAIDGIRSIVIGNSYSKYLLVQRTYLRLKFSEVPVVFFPSSGSGSVQEQGNHPQETNGIGELTL